MNFEFQNQAKNEAGKPRAWVLKEVAKWPSGPVAECRTPKAYDAQGFSSHPNSLSRLFYVPRP